MMKKSFRNLKHIDKILGYDEDTIIMIYGEGKSNRIRYTWESNGGAKSR